MQRWAEDLKQFYLCVSRFSDEAYTRAAVFPTVYDTKRTRDEAWEATESSKVLKKDEKRRHKTGRPQTSHQIFDSENQQKENKVHKQIFSLLHTTAKQEEGGAFRGDYNHVSVVSRNVKSPRHAGRHPLA